MKSRKAENLVRLKLRRRYTSLWNIFIHKVVARASPRYYSHHGARTAMWDGTARAGNRRMSYVYLLLSLCCGHCFIKDWGIRQVAGQSFSMDIQGKLRSQTRRKPEFGFLPPLSNCVRVPFRSAFFVYVKSLSVLPDVLDERATKMLPDDERSHANLLDAPHKKTY